MGVLAQERLQLGGRAGRRDAISFCRRLEVFPRFARQGVRLSAEKLDYGLLQSGRRREVQLALVFRRAGGGLGSGLGDSRRRHCAYHRLRQRRPKQVVARSYVAATALCVHYAKQAGALHGGRPRHLLHLR